MSDFRRDLQDLLNKHCKDRGSDTPDFVLAEYLNRCLETFDAAHRLAKGWHRNKEE